MQGLVLTCWNCGKRVDDLPLSLPRESMCPSCNADLHVCRQCRFFDKSKASSCAEPVADHVNDKTRSNFCGYFELDPEPARSVSQDSNPELNALFGLGEADTDTSTVSGDNPVDALNDLFGLGDKHKD